MLYVHSLLRHASTGEFIRMCGMPSYSEYWTSPQTGCSFLICGNGSKCKYVVLNNSGIKTEAPCGI